MPDMIRRALDAPLRTRLLFLSCLILTTLLLAQQSSRGRSPSVLASSVGGQGVEVTPSAPAALHEGATNQDRPKRVAVVGAGASGSAAAFFLRRAGREVERRLGVEEGSRMGEIVVFDKEGHVGGRSTTVYPHGDKRLRWQELGGSIFVPANRNMMKAAEHFNLTLIDPSYGEQGFGIWDGAHFVFSSSPSDRFPSSWLDSAKLLVRYGPLSPMRTKSHVSALVAKFLKLYDPVYLARRGPTGSVEDFAESIGLGSELTTRSGADWARAVVGVKDKWVNEIMGAATRVNYASEIGKIHALGAGVSMAAAGSSQIEGGNWQVFQSMLDASEATVHLGTEVADIVPLHKTWEPPSFQVMSNRTEINTGEPFDAVFFAAPWHSSPVSKKIAREFEQPIPAQKYVRLHVTYITTTKPHPDPAFFGLPAGSFVPNAVLTTGSGPRGAASGAASVPPPRFHSITWHGPVQPGADEYAVKIFSLTRLSDRFLREMLGEEPGWLLRKEWDSYPELKPISAYAPVEPMKGLHYLAAQEAWVSTMDTQTVSGREAVARTVYDWWGLGMGDCSGGESWDWTC
ncbi:hypothetical protein IAU60_000349 [Kwoniella sp. DSM 27419]